VKVHLCSAANSSRSIAKLIILMLTSLLSSAITYLTIESLATPVSSCSVQTAAATRVLVGLGTGTNVLFRQSYRTRSFHLALETRIRPTHQRNFVLRICKNLKRYMVEKRKALRRVPHYQSSAEAQTMCARFQAIPVATTLRAESSRTSLY
jgi:hypothetical protein